QGVSAGEARIAEVALHQGDGEHLGVGESRRVIRRSAPLRAVWMCFQVVVDEDVDFRQVLIYAMHRSSSSEGKVLSCNSILLFVKGLTTLTFPTQDSILLANSGSPRQAAFGASPPNAERLVSARGLSNNHAPTRTMFSAAA